MAIGQGVPSYDPFTVASGGAEIVPTDWMPASDCRSLVREDPCALWLDWYGDQHGFTPAASDYSFNDFVFRKGKELEAAWLHIYGDHNVRVCQHDGNARLARNLKVTLEMMNDGAPVIVHPALWWAPEKIYGAPDLIALSTWIEQNFPNALPPAQVNAGATGRRKGHYIVAVLIYFRLDLNIERNNEGRLRHVPLQVSEHVGIHAQLSRHNF